MTKLHFTIQLDYLNEHKLVVKRIYSSIHKFHLAFISKHFGNNVSCLFTYENVFVSNDEQKMKRSYLTGFVSLHDEIIH